MKLARLALVVVALVIQASTTAVPISVAANRHARAAGVDTLGRLLIVVRDSLTSAPLVEALVRVLGTRWGTLTDASGRGAILGMTPGIMSVKVSAESHLSSIDTVVVQSGGYDTLRVLLRRGRESNPADFLNSQVPTRAKVDGVATSVAKPTRGIVDTASATPRNPKRHK